MASYTIKYGDTLSGIASQTGISVQELMRLNPSITDPNKIYAGRTLNLGTSSAPASTTQSSNQNSQTIGQVAKVSVPDYVEDSTTAKIGQTLRQQATETVDEEAIRAATRARIQGQIDAINAAVTDQIANFRNTTGKDRQGQSYALAAAGGRIGSATGEAEIRTTEDFNRQEEQTYHSEANAKIAALLDVATRDATAEIAAKRAAIQEGADKYFEFLETQGQRKRDQITAFLRNMLALGVDPNEISDKDFEKIQDQYGFSKSQLIALFGDIKSAQEAQNREAEMGNLTLEKARTDANQFDLSEGQARYVYDPETGTARVIAERAKTYAPTAGSGGSGSGTTLEYSDPNYTLEAIRNSKGGRAMTQSELKPITDIQTIVGQAETLTSLIGSVDTGPIMGIIKSNNPYDTKAQLMKAAITAIVPKLARGVYGEVGVLTDADIENYSKTIANLQSTNDVNKAVMAMTLDIATRSLAHQLNSMAAGQRDVSRFEAIYVGLNEKAAAMKSELGHGAAPSSEQNFTSAGGNTYKLPY